MKTVQAIDASGNKVWLGLDDNNQWQPLSPPGANVSRGEAIAHYNKQKQEKYEKELEARGEVSQQRADDVNAMWPWETFPIKAGKASDKLMAGAADIRDFYMAVAPNREEAAQYKLPTRGSLIADPQPSASNRVNRAKLAQEEKVRFADEAEARIEARAQDQAEKDRLTKEFDENIDVFTDYFAGSSPYSATARLFNPINKHLFGAVVDTVADTTKEVGRQTQGLLTRTAEKLKQSPAFNELGEALQTSGIDPVKEYFEGVGKRGKIDKGFREGWMSEMGTSAGTGAYEGGLHYDENIYGGALDSLIGSATGRYASRKFDKAPSLLNPQTEDFLKMMRDKYGYRVTPGLQTGQPRYQIYEAERRYDPDSRGMMKAFDDGNKTVFANMSREAMGLPPRQDYVLTAEELSDHMNKLKKEYDHLEKNSTGQILAQDARELQNSISHLDKDDQKAVKKLLSTVVNIKQRQGRDKKGRFTQKKFQGKDFKEVRSRLIDARNSAYKGGKISQYRAYKKMIETLDKGMNRGVKKKWGRVKAKEWRDLNERYAMTKLMFENGINTEGQIDVGKLTKHLSSTDSERLLLGTGGRIKHLHNIAKMHSLESNAAKTIFGGDSGSGDYKGKTKKMKALTTPGVLAPNPVHELALNTYLGTYNPFPAGYPASKGLLFGLTKRNDPSSVSHKVRAMTQGSDNPTEMSEGAIRLGKATHNAYKQGKGALLEFMNKYAPDEEEEKKRKEAIKASLLN